MKRSVVYLPVLLVALAAGCGGGGGASSNSAMANANTTGMTTSDPMSNSMCDMGDMSMNDMSTMCNTSMLEVAMVPPEPFVIPPQTLTAVANGDTYTATYSQTTNSGTAMFDGQMANSSSSTLTVLENGVTIGTQTSTTYYLTSPFTPLGLTGTTGGTGYEVIFGSTNPYPATLSVGASGPMLSGTYYSPGTNVAMGSLSETYDVEPNDSMTVLLTVYVTGTLNGGPVSETIGYMVDASGNLTLSSVEVTLNGVLLNFF